MTNKKREHTAHFLISNFLMSNDSISFKLNGTIQAILRYMGDIMDATTNAGGSNRCDASQAQISRFAGVHRNTVGPALQRLLDLRILSLVKKLEDNVGVFEIGELLHSRLAVAQPLCNREQSGCTISGGGCTKYEDRLHNHCATYNTAFNTGYNTGEAHSVDNSQTSNPEAEAKAELAREQIRQLCGLKIRNDL